MKWSFNRKSNTHSRKAPFTAEPLECRTLLTATVIQPIPNQVFPQDSGTEQAALYGVFADDNGVQDLTFSATSSNPSVLTASVSSSTLTITPVAAQSGFARVQMFATDPTGARVSNTFRVQITAADNRSLDVLLGAASPTSIRYIQSNGAAATVSIDGAGSAVLHFGGDNLSRAGAVLNGANAELESITLNDTTTATTLDISGQKKAGLIPSIGNISAAGSLGRLNITNAVLDGDVNITGALPRINVDFAESGTFTIGSGAVAIAGKSFVDENFSSASPVTSVKLLQWTNSDNVPESFSAAFVRSINVRGNFTPGLQLTGDGAPSLSLGQAHIPGTIGGAWNIVGGCVPLNVGNTESDFNATFTSLPSFSSKLNLSGQITAPTIRTINVRNFIAGAVINLTAAGTTDVQTIKAKAITFSSISAAGNLGSITTGLLNFTSLLAGTDSLPVRNLPTSSSDFIASSSIQSIDIKGGVQANDFVASVIAASFLGKIILGTVMTDNSGFQFGIAAGGFSQLQFLTGKKRITLDNVHDAATLAAQLSSQNATLGDMTVEIF